MSSIKEIQNDKINAALINLETLQKEYEVTLQQYQEAGKNYITSLQSNSTGNNFVALKGRSWWGTSGLTEGPVSTQEECENMCAISSKCSGATFNPVKRYCWTRTGDSSLTAGKNDDYALISQQKSSLTTMKYLNQKLLDLNTEITNELSNINPEVASQDKEKNAKQEQLLQSYEKMLEQKIELEKQLQDYYSVEQEEENQSLIVNQQNISLRTWILITCLVVILTIKRMLGTTTLPFEIIFWLLIIIVLIILTYSLSIPSGFMMVFIFLLCIFLMKTGFLPSI
jgi:hypothetical protein